MRSKERTGPRRWCRSAGQRACYCLPALQSAHGKSVFILRGNGIAGCSAARPARAIAPRCNRSRFRRQLPQRAGAATWCAKTGASWRGCDRDQQLFDPGTTCLTCLATRGRNCCAATAGGGQPAHGRTCARARLPERVRRRLGHWRRRPGDPLRSKRRCRLSGRFASLATIRQDNDNHKYNSDRCTISMNEQDPKPGVVIDVTRTP